MIFLESNIPKLQVIETSILPTARNERRFRYPICNPQWSGNLLFEPEDDPNVAISGHDNQCLNYTKKMVRCRISISYISCKTVAHSFQHKTTEKKIPTPPLGQNYGRNASLCTLKLSRALLLHSAGSHRFAPDWTPLREPRMSQKKGCHRLTLQIHKFSMFCRKPGQFETFPKRKKVETTWVLLAHEPNGVLSLGMKVIFWSISSNFASFKRCSRCAVKRMGSTSHLFSSLH